MDTATLSLCQRRCGKSSLLDVAHIIPVEAVEVGAKGQKIVQEDLIVAIMHSTFTFAIVSSCDCECMCVYVCVLCVCVMCVFVIILFVCLK